MDSKNPSEERETADAFRHLKEVAYPKKSGVYLMKDQEGTVLYIGKANNLQSRIRHYLTSTGDGRAMIPHLMGQVTTIETIVVTSEKEALLLENNLIKEHKPKYNVLLKDDKSYFSLMINHKDHWPMVRLVRYKGKPAPGKLYFGPFTNGTAAKEMLSLMRKLFPMRTCSDRELTSRTRPCILYDMKRCIAPCVRKCSEEEYALLTEQAIQFLRGHSKDVVQKLEEARSRCIEELSFEKAETYHRSILAIERTLEKQQVEQLAFGDYDAYALYRERDLILLLQLKIREGKILGKEEHFFDFVAQSDEELLSSFILQNYEKEEEKVTILVPCSLPSQEILQEIIHQEIFFPQKGKRAKIMKIAQLNAEEAAHRIAKEKDAAHDILLQLEETLHLINYPMRIECYDNSHLSQTGSVSAKVTFKKGLPDKSGYRKYKVEALDDYAAFEEVLRRRFKDTKKEEELPDMILIDGGKGQLAVAQKVLASLDITRIDLVALTKEQGRHDKGLAAEKLYIAGQEEPLFLSPRSKELLFLQRIRDETHRFAITFQKQRRKKELLTSSLEDIPGIGSIKTKRLLARFGSIERIKKAKEEEWLEVRGITKKDIEQIKKFLLN